MTKPVRILQMIGSLNVGGSQAVILNLYKAIDRDLIQFDFIIDKPNETELVPVVQSLGAKVYTLPSFRGTNIKEVRKAWNDFFNLHPEYKILHSHVRSYASVYFPIAKKHGVKTIIHSHSTSNGKGFSAFAKMLFQLPLRYQADYFLSCSEEAGKWLFGNRAVQSDRYHLLQNAIDTSLYCPNELKRLALRKELNIGDKFVFIHIGRLHPAKNHPFLLRVFTEIIKTNKNAVLLIVGDGELRGEIKKQIEDLGIDTFVRMLGSRSDVPDLLQAADCFLFPSNWEGLPVTVVEAQAAGLPCVVSANVTNTVFISELAHKEPIDQGTENWIRCIEKMSMNRMDVSEEIRKAGFDIRETSKWITELYLTMYEGIKTQ